MLHCQCYGDPQQPALVLLHGFLGSGADWQPLLARLSQTFYCITVDLPGHGQSQHTLQHSPAFTECATLVQQSVLALGIEQFHLLGYSLGGRIALHLAAEYPQHLLSLQLESCHPGLVTEAEREQRASNDQLWQQRLAQLSMSDFLALWYQQAVFADLSEQQRQTLIAQRAQQDPASLLAMYAGTSLALQQPLWQLPSQLTCAVHYYYGTRDAKFTALAQRWQQQAPELRLHAIDAVGHNCHKGNPVAFLAQLQPALNDFAEKMNDA
ncbi:2-succinyl-6-hydroxy-2,4-cyclohexadiene-1-carboxylate synthase [Shewanella avicenniae]|uniref:Putative 2-succinyl-6-hydroxy-2,4-cyclohexadiene-1-carboxylate synthase n=1 Tax=Shewanella avicenniae TaxID=2814294 RepID=A0ABX7QQV1_9GAMM|nr:2-succinyl-6-hydroxy-2,4-cyclohexadiene-1-carboxylate synthase [Shewanella avicenniae]QSX33842.1 2-succinyl-6-hydroxy-2,4-cyclohexadiene-1-carboxylate synthase [Shewanella avicenniae]